MIDRDKHLKRPRKIPYRKKPQHPKYKQAKIYVITNPKNKKIYIGSTTISLKKRLQCHQVDSHNPAKRKAFFYEQLRHLGIEPKDCKIKLLEEFPCRNRRQMFEREKYWVTKKQPYYNFKDVII